ncbi:hypothetical protein JZ751_029549, partial [Albula glossodonta]
MPGSLLFILVVDMRTTLLWVLLMGVSVSRTPSLGQDTSGISAAANAASFAAASSFHTGSSTGPPPTAAAPAGIPQASVRCVNTNGTVCFEKLQRVTCDLTLNDLKNISSGSNLENVASSTQIMTSNPEKLTSENITSAAEIVRTLLENAQNSSEEVVVATVTTVSQLLNARSTRMDANIGFVIYQNDKFFQSKAFPRSLDMNRSVISASLKGSSRSERVGVERVDMTFQPPAVSNMIPHDFSCVFWDYTKADWSTSGCVKTNFTGTLGCSCNHTTNFAMLFAYRKDFKYAAALNLVSITGCSLSVIALSLTIVLEIIT